MLNADGTPPTGSDAGATRGRRGPPRTGTVEPFRRADGKTYYRARITLRDGSRVRVDVPAKYSVPAAGKTAKERAKLYAEARQEREDETGELYAEKIARERAELRAKDAKEGETCDVWFDRYHTYQHSQGHTDARKKRTRWRKWISPVIGSRPIASITRDDVEDVRDALDRAIDAWKRAGRSSGKRGREIAGKTAMNVWSALTSSFKAATMSKRRDLRVLDGRVNPCLGVEPPGDKASRKTRRKTFIYPREAAALLACKAVPLEWRAIYAIALYLYLRPGELRVLTLADIDLQVGHVSVTKAWDYEDGKVKPPKSRMGARKVPIEPELVPLLEALKSRAKPPAGVDAGDEIDAGLLVVPALSAFGEDHLAEQFRKHLKLAKVTRAELHASTVTHVQANFRSCRDSGITWLAMMGLGVDKIQWRAGHEHIATTLGYVKQAEDLTGELGAPFPDLPAALGGVNLAKNLSKRPGPRKVSGENEAAKGAGGGSRTPGHRQTPDDSRALASTHRDGDDANVRTQAGTCPGAEIDGENAGAGRYVAADRRDAAWQPQGGHAGRAGDERTVARLDALAARARIVERLSSDDARVVAGDVRAELEALARELGGAGARVVALADARRKRG